MTEKCKHYWRALTQQETGGNLICNACGLLTDKFLCQEELWDKWSSAQCSKLATCERKIDPRQKRPSERTFHYCTMHDPDRRKAKLEEKQAKWRAEAATEAEARRWREYRAKATSEVIDKALAWRKTDPVDPCLHCAEKICTLIRAIDEYIRVESMRPASLTV